MPGPTRGNIVKPISGLRLMFVGTPSRTASSNTVTLIQNTPPRTPSGRQSSFAHRRSVEASPKQKQQSLEQEASPSAIASDSSTSSSSSSDAPHPMNRSRMFARRPRYSSKAPLNPLSDADEEDENSPPFLPFSNPKPSNPTPMADPTATVKTLPKEAQSHRHVLAPSAQAKNPNLLATAHSSSSSVQSQAQSQNRPPSNPLSALSPKQRRAAKEGSEGTPSMGSSFSDLDDASVTQSALEEALANEMQHGGVASRMSTISQALRSRYL